MNDELTELHPDKQLALRIENGEVSKEEVERVWAETRDLAAQTDFDTRRAVVALRRCGSLSDSWPVFFTQLTQMMSQMRGAMTNENSKFAHLVAGTETIVKTLQAVNPLKERLEWQSRQIRELTELVLELRSAVASLREPAPPKMEATQAAASNAIEPEPMDWERKDEQARKETIGSAWTK